MNPATEEPSAAPPLAEASSTHTHAFHQSEIPPETSPAAVSRLAGRGQSAAADTSASTPTKQQSRGARSTTGVSSRQQLAALTAMGSKAFKLTYPLDRAPTVDGDPVHLLNGLEDSKTELMRRVNRTELAMVIEDVFTSARQAQLTQVALEGRCCGIWCRGPPPQTTDTIVELQQVVDTYNRSFERRRLQLQLYPPTGTPILLNLIGDEIAPQPAVDDSQDELVAAPAAGETVAQVVTAAPVVEPTPRDVDAVELPAQPTVVVAPEAVHLNEDVHVVSAAQEWNASEGSQLRPISPEAAAATTTTSPEVGPTQFTTSEQAVEAKPAQAQSPAQAEVQKPMVQRTSSSKDSDDEADEDGGHAAAAAAAAAAEAEAAAAARRARGAAEVLDVSFDDVDRSGLDEAERHERFLAMLKDKAAAEKAAEEARLAQMDPEEREKYVKAQEEAKKRQEAKDRMLKGQLAGYGSGRALGAKRGRGAKRA